MSVHSETFSDNELSHLCQKALFVQSAPRHINLDTVPADGNEYIHKARLEDTLYKFPTSNVCDEVNSPEQKVSSKINKYWFRMCAVEFSDLASQLRNNKKILREKFPPTEYLPLNNEEECCTFCLGSVKSCSIYKDVAITSFTEQHVPLLNYIIHFDQKDIEKLLKYHHIWFKKIGMDVSISTWIFALLACLYKPITEEQEDFLEDFYDDCKNRLKECKNDEITRLHLIMSLLHNYFCVKSYLVGPSLNFFV